MMFSRADIMDVIPHRPPFLFVSEILECSERNAVGQHRFDDEYFFKGHFPSEPIVPGVILIEGLAQTLAFLALSQVPEHVVMLTGVEKCTIRASVFPGDQVTYRVAISRTKLKMVVAQCEVLVGTRHILKATIKGFLTERDKPH
ncbi:MAG: 3-hydroxyacyl-ACP dehydratase FabZ family protein [Bradymonadia bacterium]